MEHPSTSAFHAKATRVHPALAHLCPSPKPSGIQKINHRHSQERRISSTPQRGNNKNITAKIPALSSPAGALVRIFNNKMGTLPPNLSSNAHATLAQTGFFGCRFYARRRRIATLFASESRINKASCELGVIVLTNTIATVIAGESNGHSQTKTSGPNGTPSPPYRAR